MKTSVSRRGGPPAPTVRADVVSSIETSGTAAARIAINADNSHFPHTPSPTGRARTRENRRRRENAFCFVVSAAMLPNTFFFFFWIY